MGVDPDGVSFDLVMAAINGSEPISRQHVLTSAETGRSLITPQTAGVYNVTLTAAHSDSATAAIVIASWTMVVQPRVDFGLATHNANCGAVAVAVLHRAAARVAGRYDVNDTRIVAGFDPGCTLPDSFVGYDTLPGALGEPDITFSIRVRSKVNDALASLGEDVFVNPETGKLSLLLSKIGLFNVTLLANSGSESLVLSSFVVDVRSSDDTAPGANCSGNGRAIDDGVRQNDLYVCDCSSSGYSGTFCDIPPSPDTSVADPDPPANTSDTIVYGLMVVVILLFLFVAAMVVRAQRQKRIGQLPVDFSDTVDRMLASGLIHARDSMMDGGARTPVELRRSRIELLEILGTGAFGVVRKGIYDPCDPDTPEYTVAVKVLSGDPSNSEKEDLLKEAVVTAQFKHPHVIALVGCVTSGTPYMLVLQVS